MRKDILIACDHEELSLNTPVLNLSALRGYLLVQIPREFRKYQLCEMYDITKRPREVNFFGKVIKDQEHPWMQIPTEIMSLRPGKHTYRLEFVNPANMAPDTLFISYIIQDDDPETPYVYMPNRGNKNPADNTWKDGMYSEDFYNQMRQDVQETYGYDPLLMGQELSLTSYCATCTRPDCVDCPHRQEV